MSNPIIFLSDLHLGCPFTKKNKLVNFFERIPLNTKIILVGDVIDLWRGDAYKNYISIFEGRDIEYIRGNHDIGIDELNLFPIEKIHDELFINITGRKIYITHGHIVDNQYGNVNNSNLQHLDRLIFKFSEFFNINIRKLMFPIIKIYYCIFSNFFKNIAEITKAKKCDGVICGHSHVPTHKKINDVEVFNLGSWYKYPHVLIIKDEKYAFVKIDATFNFDSGYSFKYFG